MKNNILITGLFILGTCLFSCKDHTAFTVSGTLKNPAKVKKVYLLQADSSQFKVIDSVQLADDGSFNFKHPAPYTNLFRLKADSMLFDLIAQNGDGITLNADLADKTQSYTVSGSKETEYIKAFDDFARESTDKNNKIAMEFRVRAQQPGANQDSLLKFYMPSFQKNLAAYSEQVIKFANDHPGTLAAFYAMTSLDNVKFEQQLVAYADGLNGEITKNPSVQQFIKAAKMAEPLSIGHAAPDFTVTSIDNKPVKLSDYKGKYVMLDFWASWCVPCRQENPNVVKQYAAFHNKGFNVLSISLDKDKAAWQKAVADDHLDWTQASDLNSFGGVAEMLYHIEAIPSNFLIDPQGKIIAKNLRGADLEDFLKNTLKN